MDASISRSPSTEALTPWVSAKPTTKRLPRIENSQNAGRGRSPPRITPKMAVASGNRPTKTIECAEVTWRRASAVSNGKPTTTPSETMMSGMMSCLAGRFCWNRNSTATASRPAMVARATVRKRASNSGLRPAWRAASR